MNASGGKAVGEEAGGAPGENDDEDDSLTQSGLQQAVAGLREALEARAVLVLAVNSTGVAIVASFEHTSRSEHLASLELLACALTVARQKALGHIERLRDPPRDESN